MKSADNPLFFFELSGTIIRYSLVRILEKKKNTILKSVNLLSNFTFKKFLTK